MMENDVLTMRICKSIIGSNCFGALATSVPSKKAEPFRAWLAMVAARGSGCAGAVSGKQSTEQKKSETMRFPTLNFEAFSISAILRILKLINASKTHFSINNSKSYYKMRKTLFFWFVQFHTVLEVYEPQTLV